MKTSLKQLTLAVIVSLACITAVPTLMIGTTGCASILPGHSALVVRAEQLDQMSFDTVDAFLRFEKANRDMLWILNRDIKKAADKLRTDFPPAHQSLKTAIKQYKSLRTDDSKTSLEKAMAVVEFLRTEAVKWHALTSNTD